MSTFFWASGSSPPEKTSRKIGRSGTGKVIRVGKAEQPQQSNLTIHTHGLGDTTDKNNTCQWAWVAFNSKNQVVASDKGEYGNGYGVTVNVAKFHAVIQALNWIAANMPDEPTRVLTDLQLVFNVLEKGWKCHKPHLKSLSLAAKKIHSRTNATVEWIPHWQNKAAAMFSLRAESD